jgi:hypothetical protein
MVLRHLAPERAQAQETLANGWGGSHRGYPLSDAANTLGWRAQSVDVDTNALSWLRALVADGWVIVQVFCGRLGEVLASRAEPLDSPHGPLPAGFGHLHAIVVVGADAAGFDYLDPFYPGEGQPLRLSVEEMARVWQGGTAWGS